MMKIAEIILSSVVGGTIGWAIAFPLTYRLCAGRWPWSRDAQR